MMRPLVKRTLLLLLVPLSANAVGYIITALLNDLWPRQVAPLAPDTPRLTLGVRGNQRREEQLVAGWLIGWWGNTLLSHRSNPSIL